MRTFAKKSFLAYKNPYQSVLKVFPEIIDDLLASEEYFYTGVKNVSQIPVALLEHLKTEGNYLWHTLDDYALGGRAVDMQRINPISGRPMTGSSSGTAINVLLGINDLGIGTDGGGSVLAPAISVNLFGFISPLICEKHMTRYAKQSTDNISFTPSLGFITRSFGEMTRVVEMTLQLPDVLNETFEVGILNQTVEENIKMLSTQPVEIVGFDSPDVLGPRDPLIAFLKNHLPTIDFLLVEEGPIDVNGLGDSVLGHFDASTKEGQRQGNKGLIRVANMANASAITIPKTDFASAYVLMCESKEAKIGKMLSFANKLVVPKDELLERYFRNFDIYFEDGFGKH